MWGAPKETVQSKYHQLFYKNNVSNDENNPKVVVSDKHTENF